MKYVYIVCAVACFLLGGFVSYRFLPRTIVREVPVTVTKTQTVTKEVVKQADGTVIERVVTQTRDRVKASPQPPKPQYRVGALIQIDHKPDFRDMNVSAGRRLFGDVWLDAQYDMRHKEVTVGVSYEF